MMNIVSGAINKYGLAGVFLLLAGYLWGQLALANNEIDFNIPSQRADRGLTIFAQTARIPVLFPNRKLQDITTNALHGRYTVEQALKLLIQDTGLRVSNSPTGQLIVKHELSERGNATVLKQNTSRKSFLAAASAALLSMFTPATTTAQGDNNTNRAGNILEEIIVTAQKREESVQEIPLSVSALDGARLARAGVNSPDRLEFAVPNLTFAQGGSSPRFSLRGVSSTGEELNADPVVGVFVDGVYQSRPAQAMAGFVDMERVEVVRGPQGTLYGRNTTGGSINLISKRPSTEGVEYGFQGVAGDFSHYGGRGFVNLPINDKVAVRVAGLVEERDGWAENQNISDDTSNDEDQVYFRGSVLFDISDQAELMFRSAYWSQEGQGSGFNAYKIRGTALAFDGAFNFDNGFSIFGVGGADPGGNPSDPYDFSDNLPGQRDIEQLQLSMDFTYDFGPVTFKSITSFNDFDRFHFRDADFYELDVFNVNLTEGVSTISQEIQFLGESDQLSWVAGFYYLQDDVDEHIIFGNGNDSAFFVPGSDFINRRSFIDTTSYAVFGQATWKVNDRLNLTAGVRWTEDTKKYGIVSAGFPLPFNLSGEETFSDVNWRLAADYAVSDDTLLYASVTRGFKSGGINLIPIPTAQRPAFENETVLAFEGGVKQSFDNGFVNLAVFYNDFEDIQVNTFDPTLNSSFVRNAEDATIWGVELEGELRPDEFWVITASLGYLDATYGDFLTENPLFPGPDTIDLSDHSLPRAPDFTANVAVSRDFRVADAWTLTPLVQFSYSSAYYQTEFNQPLDKQDNYTKTDVRLFLRHENGWSGEAFVTNIEDEAVLIAGVYGPGNTMFANYGAPRTFGVRIGYNY